MTCRNREWLLHIQWVVEAVVSSRTDISEAGVGSFGSVKVSASRLASVFCPCTCRKVLVSVAWFPVWLCPVVFFGPLSLVPCLTSFVNVLISFSFALLTWCFWSLWLAPMSIKSFSLHRFFVESCCVPVVLPTVADYCLVYFLFKELISEVWICKSATCKS